jgi:hypothetical protein
MFAGEHASGPRHTGLNLVEDQQDAVLVAELAQGHQEVRGCHIEPALTLHGLNNDGGDARRIDV